MIYDICIIGGGLAGLALSIDARQRGYSVVVIEKGSYPRNKVCGEYLSRESCSYLFSLCPSLKEINLPSITKFELTSTGKSTLSMPLELGGLGISRYLLEMKLYRDAVTKGVTFLLDTKADRTTREEDFFITQAGKNKIVSKIVCNAGGRYAGARNKKSKEYIGVKYHVRLERDASLIQVHNFPGGYCGISNVEHGVACLCYIINSAKVRANNSNILQAEQNVLFQNKNLEAIFRTATFLSREPLAISGIDFRAKQSFADGIFYLGDAAGTIAPITGNGMSIGLRSAKELAKVIGGYLEKQYDLDTAAEIYSSNWKRNFHIRINLSRYFQGLSEYTLLTRTAIAGLKYFPATAALLVKQTHGQPF